MWIEGDGSEPHLLLISTWPQQPDLGQIIPGDKKYILVSHKDNSYPISRAALQYFFICISKIAE